MGVRKERLEIRKGWWLVLILACLGGCALFRGKGERDWGTKAGENLRSRIRGPLEAPVIHVGGERLPAARPLSRFYLRREDRPAWIGPRGPLAHADALLRVLRQMEGDGLRFRDYHLERLEEEMAAWRGTALGADSLAPSAARLVELDLLLTDAFLRCGAHLQRGRVDPRQIHPEWQARVRPVDLAGLLQTALDLNQVEGTLLGLRPPQPGYSLLRRALAAHREIAARGGWSGVPKGRLRRGARGTAVRALCRRLAASGDLPGDAADRKGFGAELEQALRRFQRRHGVEASGRVDSATLAALNVPAEARIAQIELNMERWRWLPHDPGTRYILVRIADFELDVVESGETVINMRVVVGKPYWRTPIFSAAVTYLEFNPPWYIPRSIAVEEVLPAVRQDSTYLARKGIQVAEGGRDTARVVAADSIDWSGIAEEDFDYLFTQLPGPLNPLGRVKFFLPNPFDVYLHDTPNVMLFDQPVRDFSHGCIRLEKSLELTAYVLRETWTRKQVEEAVQSGENQGVPLSVPVPVYLLYWTAWVDEEGKVQFREDIYDSDQRLRRALRR